MSVAQRRLEAPSKKVFWTTVCSLKESPDTRKGHRLLYFPCLIQYSSEKSAVMLLRPPIQQNCVLAPPSTSQRSKQRRSTS